MLQNRFIDENLGLVCVMFKPISFLFLAANANAIAVLAQQTLWL